MVGVERSIMPDFRPDDQKPIAGTMLQQKNIDTLLTQEIITNRPYPINAESQTIKKRR
jgi:hypothetical protein